MTSEEISLRRKNTIILFSSLNRYDNYKKVTALSPHQYSNDLHFFSDTVQERCERNKKQISKLLGLLQKKIMTPQMLQYNGSNSFYPSYVLHHHFFYFYKLVEELSKTHPEVEPLQVSAAKGQTLGALFHDLINVNFEKPNYPQITNGVINMREGDYFYSNPTSLNIHICSFIIHDKKRSNIVMVKLRNANGSFCEGVKVRDMGATISPDYLNVGYRFVGVKPIAIIEIQKSKIFKQLKNSQKLTQLGFSVQDFSQALHIVVNYTKMRRQFATKDKDKTQRHIIQYQAVHSRIIDGFAHLYALAYMQQKLLTIQQVGQLFAPFLPIHHKIILQKIMTLRECCGGFGYMQVSGFPALMERVSYRASQPHAPQIPQIPELMKRIHYYSSSQQMEEIALKNIDIEKLNSFQPLFYIFVTLCFNIRKNKQKFNPVKYLQHMIIQSCMQIMHTAGIYVPAQPDNPSQDLLYYLVVNYILDNAAFINWKILKGYDKEKFMNILLQTKSTLIIKIFKQIPRLTDILEVGYLRNVIVGSDNNEQFYEKVMKSAQESKRNSEDYKKVIQKQLIELIKEQRAKL